MIVSHIGAKPSSRALRLVIVDNFYENILQPRAQTFFMGMMMIRAQAYGPDYPRHYLPLDAIDYVARHYLICLDHRGILEPVAGFRHVPLSRLDEHKLPLSLWVASKDAGASPSSEALRSIIESHREKKRQLVYSSNFAVKKSHRGDPAFSELVRELVAGLICAEMDADRVATVVCGSALRFKTRPYFERIGFRALEDGSGTEVPPFDKPSSGETVVPMSMSRASDWSRECLKKHRALLDDALFVPEELGKLFLPSPRRKAA